MADTSVAVTPGVGAPIAIEVVSSLDYQKVKVAWGPAGYVDELTELAINDAASGDTTLVAAIAAQTIRVYGFFLATAAAVNLKWKNGAGTDFHPAITFTASGYWELGRDQRPWFTCSVNTALILNLSAAVQTSGRLYYAQS